MSNQLPIIFLLLLYATASSSPASPARPHIIFVLFDDQGYNEVNWNNKTGSRYILPTLDSLAAEGVALSSNYYVGPICSPSRSMLMTGRYTTRLGTHANVIYWDTPWAIAKEEEFLPQVLSKHGGYTTYGTGKYHLGMMSEWAIPTSRGFDKWDGYLQGCGSSWTHVSACCPAGSPYNDQKYVCKHGLGAKVKDYRGYDWFKNDKADLSANGTKVSDQMVLSTKEFLHEHASKFDHPDDISPVFLYLAFQNIHGPFTTKEHFYDMYKDRTDLNEDEKVMYAYLTEADTAVGAIKDELENLGYLDKSVIIYSSDNGGPNITNIRLRNYPLRGFKSQIWEGGTMVPGLVWTKMESLLPKERRGSKSHELYHVTDWKPTIMRLAGIDPKVLNQSLPLDGHDVWDSIAHGSPSPREEMLYNINPLCDRGQAQVPKAAIRVGDMKLLCWCFNVSGIDGATETGPVSNPEDPPGSWPALYNLKEDPSETTNIAHHHPEIVEDLVERLKKLGDEMVIPQEWVRPFQGKDYYCADCPLHPPTGPYEPWAPWIES